MLAGILPSLGLELRDRVTNLVWVQWAGLGSGAVAPRPPASAIDPEALVLASLALVEHEPQLGELLTWLAANAPGLLSVQRVRNLAPSYPATVAERLARFAAYAHRAGGDHRWRPLSAGLAPAAGEAGGALAGGAGKSGGVAEPGDGAEARPARLEGAGGTVLRLRLGLGVGIKADVVAALLGAGGWWTVRSLAAATGYTPRAVRRAAGELAAGGWIRASPATPAEYAVEPGPWLPLLGLEAPAPWVHWQALFAFALAVEDWVGEGGWRAQELPEAERSARALVDAHRPALKWAGVKAPAPVSRPGEEYIRSFADAVLAVLVAAESRV